MLKISPLNFNTEYKKSPATTPSFTGDIAEPKIEKQTAVTPDYSVKTPMLWKKTDELKLPYDTIAHCYKLANGQKVVIVPIEGSTVVKTYVNTGSMNEPDKIRGISHYIEHNLFNGSKGLEEGDFFKIVDKMGASTNASTGFAETNYYIRSHLLNPDDLERKIKIHASMLETPLFALEKLKKEKGIVNSEINMITSDPENIAVNKTIKNLYNIKSSSADLIGGTTDNITNLTREDVVNYFNQNYYPANMVTVVTGEVNPDDTIRLISKYFTSKKTPTGERHYENLNPIQKTVRQDIISDKATATTIILGFNGPANNDSRDNIYLSALLGVLTDNSTSRINKNLKHLNTWIFGEKEKISTRPHDGNAILFSADTTEDNAEMVLKTIYEQINAIKTNPPTDEELQIIKKKMIKNIAANFELSGSTNAVLGETFLNNTLDSINNIENIVKGMTAKDLANTASKYLDLNKTAVTVLHPSSVDEKSIKNNYGAANNISFTGSNKSVINMDKVKQYKAHNNFIVTTNDIKSRNAVLQVEFNCDIPTDSKPAVPFILNNILNEGSAFKDEQVFQHDIEKSGIDLGFSAGGTRLSAAASFDTDDLKKAMQSITEVLYNPRFTEETFEQVKSDIRESIFKSEKHAVDKLNQELFKGTIKGVSDDEILKSLDTVTLDDIKSYYSYIMKNAKAHVTISAPFTKKPELQNVLFAEIASLPAQKEYKPFIGDTYKSVEKTKVLTDVNNKNQAEVIEAFKYKTNQNIKDNAAITMLNIILGGGPSSRLFNDLREKQHLAYAVKSSVSGIDNSNVLKLFIKTTTENRDTGEISYDNIKKSIEGFNKHIQKLLTEKISEEELNNAKLTFKNNILSGNESIYGKNESLSFSLNTPYGLNRENQLFEIIDSITVDDISSAAKYIFNSKPTYSIAATENTLQANKEFLNKLKEA